MNEIEFNKKRDKLLSNIAKCKTFQEKFLAYCKFEHFMCTKSENGYWNPKYRKDKYLLLPNGEKIPFY